jgi:pyruvate,water dikinase
MTSHVLGWSEAFLAGPARCGGKGYNLARLARYGFNVPPGCVLTADAYTELMNTPDLARRAAELAGMGADETLSGPGAAKLQEMRTAIEGARIPASVRSARARCLVGTDLADTPVAVRSSAVLEDSAGASFAGIHRSFLNVRGLEAVERAVLGCFASLWTPQAVSYRRRMKVSDHDVQCAVVICAMVTRPGADEPTSAGVAFSCDPRTGRRDLIVINAACGMGEKVVSGAVDPDQIELERTMGRLRPLNRRVHGEPVLTPEQEIELAQHIWRIHWALGDGDNPQDVEWAFDGERFWFVQARPVTRVPLRTFEGIKHLPVIWSTANIKEAVPGAVSTLSWSMIREVIDDVLYAAPLAADFHVPAGLQTVRRFKGRAYFDLTAMQWCFYDFVGLMPAEVVRAIGGHQPEIPVPEGSPFEGKAGRRRKQNMLRLLLQFLMLPRNVHRASRVQFAEVRKLAHLDYARLSDGELLAVFRQFERLQGSILRLVGLSNAYPGPLHQALESQLGKVAGEQAQSVMSRLLTGGGQVTSAEQGYRIQELADVARNDAAALTWLTGNEPAQTWTRLPGSSPLRRELERFLEEFGHRAVYEADILNPRWVEDPGYILDQVRRNLEAAPGSPPRANAAKVQAQAQAELKTLTFWRRPVIRWLARRLQCGLALRELGKSILASGVWPGRLAALEVGRRLCAAGWLDTPGQVFHLSRADILMFLEGAWDGRGARELAGDRERERAEWLSQEPPPDVIIEGDVLPGASGAPAAPAAAAGEGWRGIGVASGRACGVARLVRHPAEGAKLAQGEVLVAPSTDPGWTPLFLRACAIVMETGGYLSHGAIVAREYGIPAVVNIPGFLHQVRDGDRLLVDGDAGCITPVAGRVTSSATLATGPSTGKAG